MKGYILAVDCGTTSTRAMLYDVEKGAFAGGTSRPVTQSFPHHGWVEESAEEIYANTLACMIEQLDNAPSPSMVAGIGIANQRETVVAWERKSGKPVGPAIVWQCRRTSDFCKELAPHARLIKEKTGLVPDPYFSASKMRWILKNNKQAAALAARGELCMGTVESYLIMRLTGGSFVTDYTNASRTMLFNINTFGWDEELLALFGVPASVLARPVECAGRVGYFEYRGAKIPVAGIAGDQQASLVGQACFDAGDGKITYGTGMFMLMNTGEKPCFSDSGLITTIGYSFAKKAAYALEGSVFNAGSSVQWLRDGLGIISSTSESEQQAVAAGDNGGVYFVPAFTGLGAPYWNSEARAAFTGISRATKKQHIIRAVLESIAYSARDLADCMCLESGIRLAETGCDGGSSANDFLMQFQSDVLGVPLVRPAERESTALGAAYLAAVALGIMDETEIKRLKKIDRVFVPSPDRDKYERLFSEYRKAVKCVLMREKGDL